MSRAARTLIPRRGQGRPRARGVDPVETGSVDDWQWMYDVNVLGTLRVTKALLPALEASGGGTIVTVGSTAAFTPYEGGGGYVAAKHAETALVGTLRLELCGRPDGRPQLRRRHVGQRHDQRGGARLAVLDCFASGSLHRAP